MKKTFKILSLFILVMIIATTCFATSDNNDAVVATRNEDGESVELSDEELEAYQNLLSTPQYDYKYGDVFATDTNELSAETVVYGNIYLMGEDFDINVTAVLGNIYVMGNNISITSQEVTGNIYVMGKDN